MQDLIPEHPDEAVYHGNIADDVGTGQTNMQVSVVSPDRELYAGPAHWITAPGSDGQFGVWPRHMSMVSALGSGMLRIGLHRGERLEYLVRGAFLSVNANVVTVLIDRAITDVSEIDVEAARAELADANERLTKRLDNVEFAEMVDRRGWCQAQLRFANAS